jgi:hypothetical protein
MEYGVMLEPHMQQMSGVALTNPCAFLPDKPCIAICFDDMIYPYGMKPNAALSGGDKTTTHR